MKKKKFFLSAVSAVCLGLSIAGAVRLCEAEAKTCGNTVGIGYYMDFNGCAPYSETWESDCYSWDFVTVTPDMRYLGVGKKDVTSEGSGYIEYCVVAENGRTIDRLALKMKGRVFHLEEHDGCSCGMTVRAGETPASYVEAVTYQPSLDGGLQTMTVDLTEYAAGKTECFVRIEMSGLQWDWVGISDLEFVGAYNAAENEIVFDYEQDVDKLLLAETGEKTPLIKAVASDKTETYAYDVFVEGPDGGEVVCDEDGFIAELPGTYTVIYTVSTGGEVVGKSSYEVFVVAEKSADAYESGNLTDRANYYTDGGGVVGTENGLRVTGSGLYVLPFEFTRMMKFVWSFESIGEGASAAFALLAHPVRADFSKKEEAGFYFVFYNEADGMKFNACYTDGENFVSLGDQPDGFVSPSVGKHALELRKSTAAEPYDKGAELYVDGVRFSDWLCYSAVDLPSTFPEGKIWLSYAVQEGAAATIEKAVDEDSSFPIIKTADGETLVRSGVVGEPIAVPRYYAEDETDGLRPVVVTITDPYSNVVEPDENNVFIPQYEGTYRVSVTSADLSGNVAERKSSILVSLKEGMCSFRFTDAVEVNARVGRAYTISVPEVLNLEAGGELKISVTDPDGNEAAIVNNTFTPEKAGTYVLTYSAENSLGVSLKSYSVYAKIDVDEKASYENFRDGSYWVSENEMFESADGGIRVWGSAYLQLPFDMQSGVELTLKPETLLNKNETDCWFSIGLIDFADYGSYASQRRYGVYFMLFREYGVYKYNVLSYGGQGVVQTVVSSCVIGSVSDVEEIVLRVEKYTGDASFDDNIVIYVNNAKNENYSVYNIAMSDMTDNEGFTYLCFDSYTTNTAKPKKEQTCFVLTKVAFSDYAAPVAQLSAELPRRAEKGQTIVLPDVEITDNVDGVVVGKIRLYAPDGSIVDISSGTFTADTEGRYLFVVKASDSSGNSLTEIYGIAVGDASPVKEYTLSLKKGSSKGCASSLGGAAYSAAAVFAIGVFIGKKVRKTNGRREHG